MFGDFADTSVKKIPAHVDGGANRGFSMHRPRSVQNTFNVDLAEVNLPDCIYTSESPFQLLRVQI